MPETAVELDLNTWEELCDGLIFFDLAGKFAGCSAKMTALAGSEDAVGTALRGERWPAEFATNIDPVSIFRCSLPIHRQKPARVEIQCVRTAAGFVAAVRLQNESQQESERASACDDSAPEIFLAHLRERRAISQYLHGALTQDLVALSLSLSGLREEGIETLSDAIAHVNRCCQGVRALSYLLAPPAFLDSGLIETIRWYGSVLRADAGVDFSMETGDVSADPPSEIKDLLFAGLQYMAAVAMWNPRDAALRVRCTSSENALSIHVQCVSAACDGLTESPLIRERARSLGGDAHFVPGSDESSLEIRVPWVAA